MNDPAPLSFEAIVNFRDLGGYPAADGATVRHGVVYRSGHLSSASAADLEALSALGLRLVVDFRGKSDIATEGPDRLPDGVEHLNLPMFDRSGPDDIRSVIERRDPDEHARFFGDGRSEAMCRQGAISVAIDQRSGYSAMLTRFAAGDVPAVLHCSAGKDRAGWGAAVVLFTLGVDTEVVRDDYLRSNEHRRAHNEAAAAALTASGIDPDLVRPLFEVRPAYFDGAVAAVVDRWGSVDGYLTDGLGVTADQRDALRTHCLV